MKTLKDVIIRHPRERKSKCSVEPLRGRADFLFHEAKLDLVFDATGYVLLDHEAIALSESDKEKPLLLLDATWRLLPRLQGCLRGTPLRRSIPSGIKTAYPRKSKVSDDPDNGLATIEALYVARYLLGRSVDGLLDQYYWKDDFLSHLQENHFF